VQDISSHMLSEAQGIAIQDLEGRLTFQQHDFFNPQPVHDASAFLLRQCLHNYNDRDCIKILRGVVPALEQCNPGTPLLINDIILPESSTMTRHEERHIRQVDLTMLVALGAKQRTEREFYTLFKEADPRFEVSSPHLHTHTSLFYRTTKQLIANPFYRLQLVNMNTNALGVGLLEVHLDAT
jgi:hypothetical protein